MLFCVCLQFAWENRLIYKGASWVVGTMSSHVFFVCLIFCWFVFLFTVCQRESSDPQKCVFGWRCFCLFVGLSVCWCVCLSARRSLVHWSTKVRLGLDLRGNVRSYVSPTHSSQPPGGGKQLCLRLAIHNFSLHAATPCEALCCCLLPHLFPQYLHVNCELRGQHTGVSTARGRKAALSETLRHTEDR